MAETAGQVTVRVGANIRDYQAKMQRVQNSTKQIGNRFSALKGIVGVAMAGMATMAIRSAVQISAAFEKSMNQVKAVTGATNAEMTKLTDQAKRLGSTTKFTAGQAAEAMGFLGMAGMEVNSIMGSMDSTLNLAAAGNLELADSADIVTNIMTGMQIPVEDLAGTVDILAKQFTTSNTNLQQLGEAMKFVGPVSSSFGVNIETTSAALGALSNAGLQASMAGTGFRRVLSGLVQKQKQLGITTVDAEGKMLPFTEILKKMEERGLTAGEALKFFGERGGPAMLALLNTGSEAIERQIGLLEQSEGTAKRIAETQMKGLTGAWTELKSAAEGLALSLNEKSGLTNSLEMLADMTSALFRSMSGGNINSFSNTMGKDRDIMNSIFNALKNTNIQTDVRRRLLSELSSNYKEYIPKLLKEESTINDITEAQEKANSEFTKKIKQTQIASELASAEERRNEILTKQAELLKIINKPVTQRTNDDTATLFALGTADGFSLITEGAAVYNEQLKAVNATILALKSNTQSLTGVDNGGGGGGDKKQDNTPLHVLTEMSKEFDLTDVNKQIDAMVDSMGEYVAFKDIFQQIAEETDTTLAESDDEYTAQVLDNVAKRMAAEQKEMQLQQNRIKMAINVGQQIGMALSKEKGERKKAIMEMIKFNASMIVSDMIRAAVAKSVVLGPVAQVLVAGAAAAAATGLINSIPALAEGGLAMGPTMAIVGDNPNARANPEVIAPLDKLQGMLKGSGGGTVINVSGFIGDERSLSRELIRIMAEGSRG